MSKTFYHSALRPELWHKPAQFSKIKHSVNYQSEEVESFALLYDLANEQKLHKLFDTCDLIYGEPSWKAGNNKFNHRANSKNPFEHFVSGIVSIIENRTVPAFILTSKSESNRLPEPDQMIYTKLHGAVAVLNVYGYDYKGSTQTNWEILNELAKSFNRVGDFCCGYGNTGRVFREHGKSFVMSDYNAKCVGFINEYYKKR